MIEFQFYYNVLKGPNTEKILVGYHCFLIIFSRRNASSDLWPACLFGKVTAMIWPRVILCISFSWAPGSVKLALPKAPQAKAELHRWHLFIEIRLHIGVPLCKDNKILFSKPRRAYWETQPPLMSYVYPRKSTDISTGRITSPWEMGFLIRNNPDYPFHPYSYILSSNVAQF